MLQAKPRPLEVAAGDKRQMPEDIGIADFHGMEVR
jgi:hypothetical protein